MWLCGQSLDKKGAHVSFCDSDPSAQKLFKLPLYLVYVNLYWIPGVVVFLFQIANVTTHKQKSSHNTVLVYYSKDMALVIVVYADPDRVINKGVFTTSPFLLFFI